MKKLFLRCNSGHYFQNVFCPWDGWTMDGCAEVVERAKSLEAAGVDLTLESVGHGQTDANLIRRMLIIEFGDERLVFEALRPERYLHRGKVLIDEDSDVLELEALN